MKDDCKNKVLKEGKKEEAKVVNPDKIFPKARRLSDRMTEVMVD